MLVLAVLLLFCAFLRTKGETYALTAAFFGADTQQAVPAVPYFAYFLFGMWVGKKKPGFQWKIAGMTAAVTIISLVLYRTPLQDLCRVTVSLLPVYLVYAVSEVLSDLTVRFYVLRFITETVELVFAVYAVYALVTQYSQIDKKKSQLAELNKKISVQEIKNDEITNIYNLSDKDNEDYIEQKAKEDGYLHAGERVFVNISGD